MKLLRNVGDTSQILNVFVQDASVSTGAGLANVTGANVSYSWWHDSQAAASTGTASTAMTMGTFTTSGWVQVSSSQALGWYQFGAPNGMFAAGKSAALHLYGATNMVPVPIEIDLNAEVNVTDIQGSNAVTSAAGQLTVSTQALSYSVNVTSIQGSSAVTSAAGQFQVSTQALSYGVNVTSIVGSAAVTSAAGQLQVSTQALSYAVNVTSIVGSAAVTSGAGILNVSTQTLPGGLTGNVNVTSIAGSAVVTSAAGILNVSTQTIDKTGYSVTGLNAALLDVSVSSRLAATAYTAPDNTGIANVSSVINNALAESYRTNGGTGTIAQLMYEIIAHMGEVSITGTTKTINTIGHTSAAATFQLDSSTAPSSIKRIT